MMWIWIWDAENSEIRWHGSLWFVVFSSYKELILCKVSFIAFKMPSILRLVFPFLGDSIVLWWAGLLTFSSSEQSQVCKSLKTLTVVLSDCFICRVVTIYWQHTAAKWILPDLSWSCGQLRDSTELCAHMSHHWFNPSAVRCGSTR